METRQQYKWYRQISTYLMLMTTLFVWGYVIGTILQQRTQIKTGYAQVFGIDGAGSSAARGLQMNSQISPMPVDQSLNMQEHRRFIQRDKSFALRLSYDEKFLIENSF
jgi:hypothetical protein